MSEYENYYSDQAKGIFRAPPIKKGYGQTGRGIGKMLTRFMQWITPLARKHLIPSLETGAKYLGHNIVDGISGIAKDTIEGKKIAEASKDRFEGLVQNLKRKVETTLDPQDGEGINKGYVILKPQKIKKSKKSKRVKDIFDNIL
jgi:hypothetical protein